MLKNVEDIINENNDLTSVRIELLKVLEKRKESQIRIMQFLDQYTIICAMKCTNEKERVSKERKLNNINKIIGKDNIIINGLNSGLEISAYSIMNVTCPNLTEADNIRVREYFSKLINDNLIM